MSVPLFMPMYTLDVEMCHYIMGNFDLIMELDEKSGD